MTLPKLANEIWRDYDTDGVPSSGARDVFKPDMRAWMRAVESTTTFRDPRAFGAQGDGIMRSDGAITATDNTFTSAGAAFAETDVGKLIKVGGAGAAGATLITTIADYNSPTSVELTAAAGTTVTGANFTYGTNDTAAILAAIDYCWDNDIDTLVFTTGRYCYNGNLEFAHSYFSVIALGQVWLESFRTTSGPAVSLNGLTYDATYGAYDFIFGGVQKFNVRGNSNCSSVVYYNGVEKSYIRVNVRDGNIGVLGDNTGAIGGLPAAVSTIFEIRCKEDDLDEFDVQPAVGWYCTETYACKVEFLEIEKCGGAGPTFALYMANANGNVFEGGTIESNSHGGAHVTATCKRNKFQSIHNELNGLGPDWQIDGHHNKLSDCAGVATAAALATFANIINGDHNHIDGGDFHDLQIASGAVKTLVTTADLSGGLVENNSGTSVFLNCEGYNDEPGSYTLSKTANYTAVAQDRGNLIIASSGTWTLSLTAAATLGDGWFVHFRNNGTGIITIDPDSSEDLYGPHGNASTLAIYPNEECTITCNGATFLVRGNLKRHPNLCLNPGMQVWQNDTTLAAAAHRAVLADGWLWGADLGSAVFTLSRSTDVPAGSEAPYSIKVDCTTADASPAAGVDRHIRYAIYGFDLLPWAATDLTIKFWVKSNKVATFCVAAINEARDRTYVREYTTLVTNTWEEKTITIPLSTKTGSWNTGHGFGLGLRFTMASGTTYQTTANAWQSGNFNSTSNQTNLGDNTANEFFITAVRVCPGPPPNFVLPPYDKAWADAQRQYRVIDTAVNGVNMVTGFAPTTGAVNFDLVLGTPMYAPPSVSLKGTLDTDVQVQTPAGVATTGGTFATFARSKDYAKFSYSKAASFVAGDPYYFRLETTSGKLVVDGHLA